LHLLIELGKFETSTNSQNPNDPNEKGLSF
jgi:hypothetical protein